MDPGWQKYIETLDKRIEALDGKLDSRMESIGNDMRKLLAFKWQLMGGGLAIAALVGVVTQFLIALIGMGAK